MKLKGKVVHGINHRKPFKTANVNCSFKKGIYTGMTKYGAALVMSQQEADNIYDYDFNYRGLPSKVVEVYIIGWEGNLYGEELEVWDIIEIPKIRRFE